MQKGIAKDTDEYKKYAPRVPYPNGTFSLSKLFLDASVEERARRRAEQRGLDPDGPEGAVILEALRRRDRLDASRAVAPLRVPPDARIITTDGNAFEDTVAAVVGAIRDAQARLEPAPGSLR